MAGYRKDVDEVLRKLRRLGVSVERTRGNHWKATLPGCQPVILARNPTDFRVFRNSLADIKRNLGITL